MYHAEKTTSILPENINNLKLNSDFFEENKGEIKF